MLPETLNAVWEALARLKLAGENPSLRDIQDEALVSLSSVEKALNELEDKGIVFVATEKDGSRKDRSITLHIWPSTFGVGANTDPAKTAAESLDEKVKRAILRGEIHLDYFKD